MVRHRTLFVDAGGRGGTTDAIYLSGFNVERIVCSCVCKSNGTTGQLQAVNGLLNYFQPYANAAHDDVPKAYYGFLPPDTGATAHESVSGAAGTIGGVGGVVIGNVPGAARYASLWGALQDTASATFTSRNFLVGAEEAAISWSFEAWCFYRGGANAEFYMESNAGITNYLQMTFSTTGVLSIVKAGGGMGGGYVSAAGVVPINQWFHLGISFISGPSTLQPYINAVATGAATAYTRASTGATDRAILNRTGSGQATLAGVELYQNVAMVANDYQRHIDYVNTEVLTGGFVAGTANLGLNSPGTVIFSNDVTPGFDSASYTVRMPLTMFQWLYTTGGVFQCEIDIWEED